MDQEQLLYASQLKSKEVTIYNDSLKEMLAIDDGEGQIQEMKGGCQKVESEPKNAKLGVVSAIKLQGEQIQQQIDSLNANIKVISQDNSALRTKVVSLTKTISDNNELINGQQKQINGAVGQINQLNDLITQLVQQNNQMGQNFQIVTQRLVQVEQIIQMRK